MEQRRATALKRTAHLTNLLAEHYEALTPSELGVYRKHLVDKGFFAAPPVDGISADLVVALRELIRSSPHKIVPIGRSPGRSQGPQEAWEDTLKSVSFAAARIIEAVLGAESLAGRNSCVHAAHPFLIDLGALEQRVHRDQPFFGVSFFFFLTSANEFESPVVFPGTHDASKLPVAPATSSGSIGSSRVSCSCSSKASSSACGDCDEGHAEGEGSGDGGGLRKRARISTPLLPELPSERFEFAEGTIFFFFAGLLHFGQAARSRPQLRVFCSIKFADSFATSCGFLSKVGPRSVGKFTVTDEDLHLKGWREMSYDSFDSEVQVKVQ
jgi:hypothetical protein